MFYKPTWGIESTLENTYQIYYDECAFETIVTKLIRRKPILHNEFIVPRIYM